jgi:DNA polymerase
MTLRGTGGTDAREALEEAGGDRSRVYVTNAVQHFKFVERGKRRTHGKPTGIETAEIAVIQPESIACLGATAAQTLMGRSFRSCMRQTPPVGRRNTGSLSTTCARFRASFPP